MIENPENAEMHSELDRVRAENVKLRAELDDLRAIGRQTLGHLSPRDYPDVSPAWPSTSDVELSTSQAERYSRQIVLPVFGPEGNFQLHFGP